MHLTDPNVVLTLANARGVTEFYVRLPEVDDAEKFDRLNAHSLEEGIRFSSAVVGNVTGEENLMVVVESLSGVERTDIYTFLPGLRRFKPADGFKGFQIWLKEAEDAILSAEELRPLSNFENLHHALGGFLRGYPAVAVLACLRKPREQWSSTCIPYADYYLCAEPNYDYHCDDEVAVAVHVGLWSRLLESYYRSDTHQMLASDAAFLKARRDQLSGELASLKRVGLVMLPRSLENALKNL
jgi:hypothetical protein